MKKISLIGFGNIGSQIAIFLRDKELEIVAFDIRKEAAEGKILDIKHCPNVKADIYFTDSYESLKNSDCVVITAGLPRKDGQTREGLLNINKPIIQNIAIEVKKNCPDAFVIMVTNPVDVMLYEFIKTSNLPKQQCIGMSSSLDTERFRHVLADYFSVNVEFVETFVLGEHNDRMFFVKEMTKINNISIQEYIIQGKISETKLNELFDKSKVMGATINKLTGSSAYIAPAMHCVNLIEKIFYQQNTSNTILASYFLEGENGKNNVCEGSILKINKKRVEKVVDCC